MIKQHFDIWKSKKEFPNSFFFVSIFDERMQALKIVIEEIGIDIEGRTFQVEFKNPAFYRVSDEGLRLRTLAEVDTYRDFAVSSNSDLLRWFHEESFGIVENENPIHYLICCENAIIDVLCFSEAVFTEL